MKVALPGSLQDALERLSSDPALVPIAGATDLLVHWPENDEAHDRDYLDLSGITELRPHRWSDDALVIGGLTTYWDLIRDPEAARAFPLLIDAGRQVGAIQIQARGTWAGNIANASPAADGVPVLMAYDATVTLGSADGTERVALDEFYLGYKEMRKRPDQLITAIALPRRPYDFERFIKVGPRAAQAITKVGVAITHSDAGWRVVANSVAPTVRRCRALERALDEGRRPESPESVGALLDADVSPIDDIRSTAEYRLRVLSRVVYHALRDDRETRP